MSFTFSWRLRGLFYGLTLGSWGLAIVSFGIIATGEARFIRDELPDRIHDLGRKSEWSERRDRTGDGRGQIDAPAAPAPAVPYDANRDSLVIIVRSDGSPNDTVVVSSRVAPGVVPEASEASEPATPPANGRVEIRRTE